MRRIPAILWVGFCACVLMAPPAPAAQCDATILPTPGPGGGQDACNYTYVPFSSITFSNGHLSANWAGDYQILESYIVADDEVVASYVPGSNVLFSPAQGKQHYNFLGRFKLIATGEEFLEITPIWCIQSQNIPAPFDGCYTVSGGDDCTVTSKAGNCPGTSVTCSGDHGTCTDCGTDSIACCSASTTTTIVIGNVTKKTVAQITASAPCPPLPSPSPSPSPGP